MSKIRKLYFNDRKSALEMVSFLNNSANDSYLNRSMFNPFILFHHLLPLKLKFLPESYVLKENKELKGLITVAPSKCPLKRMEIEKLLFEENNYEVACELIQYVVSRYKAMGTASFIVRVDDYLPELVRLFISRCSFSQISYEKLWRISRIKKCKYNPKQFRLFRNSDAQVVANLYNDYLLPHFRPLVGKEPAEFNDMFFRGLYYLNEYKYVMEDNSKNIAALITIQTSDNSNFIIDVVQSSWADIDIKSILSFARDQIRKRKKRANIFIKTKKYTQVAEMYEKEFLAQNFECIQNRLVLTNSSAKIIKSEGDVKRFTALNGFFTGVSLQN